MKNNYIIRTREAHDNNAFVNLRSKVFGDDKEFIDFFDDCFKGNYLDFVIIESQGEDEILQAALTQFTMGKLVIPNSRDSVLGGKDVEISYAICTDERARGKGYGSHITVYAGEIATSSRRISMLSPAEPSLINFYAPLGYREFTYGKQGTVDAININDNENESAISIGSLAFESLSAAKYNEYREAILKDRIHISLSKAALKFVCASSMGREGLLLIREATTGSPLAIAACDADDDSDSISASEILTFDGAGGNFELGMPICRDLAVKYGKSQCNYMMPSNTDSENAVALGLISATDDELSGISEAASDFLPYMGFTFG